MPLPRGLSKMASLINPLMSAFARRIPPMVIIEHTGRRSGKEFKTPVQAFRTERGYVMCLMYGKEANWAKNLVAAEGGHMIRRGRRYRLSEPKRLEGRDGSQLMPGWARATMGMIRAKDYIELTAVEVRDDEPAAGGNSNSSGNSNSGNSSESTAG